MRTFLNTFVGVGCVMNTIAIDEEVERKLKYDRGCGMSFNEKSRNKKREKVKREETEKRK